MEASEEDVHVEANWYDELAGVFETLGARYRDAACVLRVSRGRLQPGELEDLRRELLAITERTIDATGIGRVLLEQQGGSLK